MNQFELQAEQYWNERYQKEGQIWGESPSRAVKIAIQLFRKVDARYILVPGCGYGRMSRFLSMKGLDVTGVDIAGTAIEMARQFDPEGVYYQASTLNMDFDDRQYDAIFAFNVLHLMLKDGRKTMISECRRKLKKGGLLFFTVFSEKEEDFGKGKEVEPNTFQTRPGRPAHYFSQEDLASHFEAYQLVESGMVEEPEDHGGKPHKHQLRYICMKV